MATKTTRKLNICCKCGATLTATNSREVAPNTSITEYSPFCLDCEQKQYDEFCKTYGAHIALFHTCSANNVPFLPFAVAVDKTDEIREDFTNANEQWKKYIEILKDTGKYYNENDGTPLTFFDGETNIMRIFGRQMTESDFSRFLKVERNRIEKLPGTEHQRKSWGYTEGGTDTTERYNELDRIYGNRLETYKGISLTPQMDATLRQVAEWTYKMEAYLDDGNVRAAKDIQTMIETALASEQMRKKDEKPVETARIDALVLALEKNGLMKDGSLLPCDEMIEALRDKFIKSRKYDYSRDVADQVVFAILNATRKNQGLATLQELPEEYSIEDIYGECLPEETEKEKNAKKYAGLTKVQVTTKKGGDK